MIHPSEDKVFAGRIPEIYETYAVPLMFEPYAADLATRVTRTAVTSVLEIAAGTGVVTRALATSLPASVSIVATDLNGPMLDYAASRGTSRPVQWRQADAMDLPFEDETFDAVVCQFGVMFFPDRTKAYAEARRVLKPGGTFLFNAWDAIRENEFADTVTAALRTHFPADPPVFLARIPHGYHDVTAIARDLVDGGFDAPPKVSRVTARSRAASARDAATAFCQGTPLRNEIEARDAAALEAATDVAAAAIAARFGAGAVEGKIQANVVVVTKSPGRTTSRNLPYHPGAPAVDGGHPRTRDPAMQPAESPPEIYERYMVPAIFDAWVPLLLDLVAPEPGERLLDLACGTGAVAKQALSRVRPDGCVVGLDLHPGMLARARASTAAVEWHQGNALSLSFSDSAFDVVVCQQGLQFFPDRIQALREGHRILRPGGRFAAAVWCAIENSPGHHALARALERHIGADAAGLLYGAFGLGDAQTLHNLLEAAGFQDVRVQRERRVARFPSTEHFTRWLVVGSVLGRSGVIVRDETLDAIIRDVDGALQPYVNADGLVFPMDAHLAFARASR